MKKDTIPPHKPNWVKVTFGYDQVIVVTSKAATAILGAMEDAYTYKKDYDKQPEIFPFISNTSSYDIQFSILSHEDFLKCRMNNVLGVNNGKSD